MDVNAHLKVEMVLNEDENEDEKRFNEIICYDSGGESSHEQSDPPGMFNEYLSKNQPQYLTNFKTEEAKHLKKSNAAQMRKYRAKQRSDPARYQQYLERERIRNYKRKYEKRIQAAQDRAIEHGIPYIVLEPYNSPGRRGRKPKFPSEYVSFVLPAKYEDDYDDESNSNSLLSDDMPMIPVEVELQESDEIYQEQKPNISVVNINKLMNQPRSALQTLLPQEVHERERVSNFIRLEHDYVKQMTDQLEQKNPFELERLLSKKGKRKNHKYELMKLQEQCRDFILQQAMTAGNLKKRKRRPTKTSRRKTSSDFVSNDCVEHEDLDDLFKELAEVATKEPIKHTPKTSPLTEDQGGFSLTVSMPVQRIVAPKSKAIKKLSNGENDLPENNSTFSNDMQLSKNVWYKENETFNCNEDSIEIKHEPISSDEEFM